MSRSRLFSLLLEYSWALGTAKRQLAERDAEIKRLKEEIEDLRLEVKDASERS